MRCIVYEVDPSYIIAMMTNIKRLVLITEPFPANESVTNSTSSAQYLTVFPWKPKGVNENMVSSSNVLNCSGWHNWPPSMFDGLYDDGIAPHGSLAGVGGNWATITDRWLIPWWSLGRFQLTGSWEISMKAYNIYSNLNEWWLPMHVTGSFTDVSQYWLSEPMLTQIYVAIWRH